MAYCCVPGCESNNYHRTESDRDLSFHRFPSHPLTRRAWIDKITMLDEDVDPHFKVTDNTKVCDKHFTEDCKVTSPAGVKKLRKGSVPTLFTGCRPLTRWTIHKVQRDPQSVQDMKTITTEKETALYDASEVLRDHDYSLPLAAREQLLAARKQLDRPGERSGELNGERFFLQRFQHEPDVIRFYTGFEDYNTLKAFYLAMQPTPETIWRCSVAVKMNSTGEITVDAGFHAQHLCLFDQLVLFLCFVRRGFLPVDMSERFQVSEATVQTTCLTWCHYLFFMLGTLPVWPSRRAVDELMPPFFKTTFPKTRVVLDFTEIHVQTATCAANSARGKGSTALKSLFGVTPSGSVSLVSSVHAASISDRNIVRESGLLNLLEPGDQVMADRSLYITDLLQVVGARLVTPTSHAQHVSHLKILVERATSRVKEYRIFDGVVPAALCGSVSQLWTVCALLTNIQGPLL